jgi:ketosteroid isomerase-like protein
MRSILLAIAFLAAIAARAGAQQAEIDAANGKWVAFFNKGDFDGVASLYTADATAFPPGSALVKGRAAMNEGK